MSEAKAKPNLSLRRKSSARQAAVQALYQLSITGETLKPEKLVAQFRKQVEENPEDRSVVNVPPHYTLMESLLSGIRDHRAEIDGLINEHLTASRKRERMSALSIAILQAAIYELRFHEELKPAILIKEYGDLAGKFLDGGEVDFVTALLNKLAPKLRR